MKIALAHDYLNQFGGAERVVVALNEIYPEAPIFTSIFNGKALPPIFQQMDIRTSFMQRLPFVNRWFKLYFSIYPLAFESFDLSGFDVILSSSSAFAKGVKKNPGQLHVCYCYTPMRFVWRYDDYVQREGWPGWLKQVLPLFLEPIKKWDLENSRRVDHFIAISRAVAERIKKIYGRDSAIIYPPVETSFFMPSAVNRDYFVILSRLNSYKRVDVAMEAFNSLGLPLKIIGDGPDRRRLEAKAGKNIQFLGRRSDVEAGKLLAECRALIFPGEEDFGIVPLEAMACGRPVIAFKASGALETVIDGETGLFFGRQTPQSLIEAVNKFNFVSFNKEKIRRHALKFDKAVFQEKIREFVKRKYEERFGQE